MGNWSDQRNGGDAGVHPTSDDLNAYLDGMAGEGEGARIARHVDGCARCREELAGLRATAALLRALPEPRPRRSFQLGPEHARSPESFWDRLGLRLLPALPALRAATVAVALLLVGVTAAEWFEDDQSPASVSQEQAQVAPTATAVSGAGRSAAPAAAEDAPPTSTEPLAPAMAANQPSTADTPAAAAPTPKPPAPAPGAAGAEVGEAEESEAVTSAEDGADDAAAQGAAPTADAAQTFEIAAADEAAAEPETGAEIADGDEATLPEQSTGAAEAAADTSAASSSNADIRVANDQAALASPPATIAATPAPASPTPAPATPTPAAPAATAAAGESRSVSAAPADDSLSGWRLAQIAFAALLACLIALLVIVRRARPRATA